MLSSFLEPTGGTAAPSLPEGLCCAQLLRTRASSTLPVLVVCAVGSAHPQPGTSFFPLYLRIRDLFDLDLTPAR